MPENHVDKDEDVRRKMAEEELVTERVDKDGTVWKKAYFGGGAHFENWLAQCRELGRVEVEEVDPAGFKCFERSGEKLYRIWIKMDDMRLMKSCFRPFF